MFKSDLSYLFSHYSKFNFLFRKELRKVESYDRLSTSDLAEIKNRKFLELFTAAMTKSDFYKKKYSSEGIEIGDIKSLEDISKLPVLTKSEIRDNLDGIYVGGGLKRDGFTSGTSGSPLKVIRSYRSILKEAAYMVHHRNKCGLNLGQRCISLRGQLDRGKMSEMNRFSNTLYLSSYNLKESNLDFYYNEISKFKPKAILAFPSSLELLANFFHSKNRKVYVPLVFTSSDTLTDAQRIKIKDTFGATVYDRYGNAERSICIEEYPNDGYREALLYGFNEYHSDHALSTSFLDNSFPLIRYMVDDVIEYTENPFKINKIVGRNDDFLTLKDGTKMNRLAVAFKDVENIDFAQIHQDSVEYFIVKIVKRQDYSKDDEDKLIKNLRKRVGDIDIRIDYSKLSDIQRTEAGKFKLVHSTLNK